MLYLLEFRNDLLKRTSKPRALKLLSIVSLALTSSCGTSVAQTTDTATGGTGPTVVTPPTPAPTPTPTPSPTLGGEIAVADNFATAAAIERTGYPTGIGGGTPPESIDASGAFRMFCTSGQLLKDDPIVYPGQPGVSHLHQFFGNTAANAGSSYASLRTSGGTTCGKSDAPVNRSAYWFPAMLDGAGNAVKPDYVKVYYKRVPASDPNCQPTINPQARGLCVGLPNGLRFIFGYNMTKMSGGPTDTAHADGGAIRFECWGNAQGTVGSGTATGHYQTLADMASAGCPTGAQLIILAGAPDCWDGVNLDTADHRSHLVYGTGTDYGPGRVCPATNPYVIPQLTFEISFTIDANFQAGKWHLSSDEMIAGVKGGTTFHLDYWEAWSPTVKATWNQYCIDGHLSCSSGDLGNGTDMINAGEPTGSYGKHELVPLQ